MNIIHNLKSSNNLKTSKNKSNNAVDPRLIALTKLLARRAAHQDHNLEKQKSLRNFRDKND
jgi:hypothetical protein